ncbi:thioredoxin-disulfide reductase [Desulfovibrio legallii]|uniref:Thioredoxin reductase n=2 Tax=Desulfovibrio TaxID=872 RepID=A0A6H3FEX9_9BACT|nr:thioredoxin-disulfide reductase [Desulfovibrio legallii]RHH26230.1 thioredoxin-disulfide reductase [Desulfovibrio sp. AM18-2]TBH81835.1 thioredoxin-disulfide reductase [Desulfovibrio legallii]CAI3225447.1 Thioredoxin reductase (EC [Desulfovibrio diazotrophicus]VVU43061.1 Thioredoxin reductase (EC [Desulfovibrio diazotrophicus]
MKSYDAVVIGGGPAGITAAMYLARSGCSVLMPEQLAPGGQILQTEAMDNYPGFPKGIKGYELADLFAAHLEGLAIDRPAAAVESVSGSAGQFVVRAGGVEYGARTVVVCSGAHHRKLGLEGEDRLRGRGVSYCALCDGNFFRNQTVAVVGGGNAALEESLYLSKLVSKLYLIHRRDEFRARKIYQDKLTEQSDKITLLRSSVVTALHGEKELTGLTVKNLKSGEETLLPVNGLFVYVGFSPSTGFLPADLAKDEQGFIITDTEMRTNIPGIFAAGDIRSKLCRQVITAAGDGATAAQAAFVLMEQLHA